MHPKRSINPKLIILQSRSVSSIAIFVWLVVGGKTHRLQHKPMNLLSEVYVTMGRKA